MPHLPFLACLLSHLESFGLDFNAGSPARSLVLNDTMDPLAQLLTEADCNECKTNRHFKYRIAHIIQILAALNED